MAIEGFSLKGTPEGMAATWNGRGKGAGGGEGRWGVGVRVLWTNYMIWLVHDQFFILCSGVWGTAFGAGITF